MRIACSVCLFVFTLLACNSDNTGNKQGKLNYTGSWYWKSEDSSASFKITFIVKNDSIFGQYCAAYNSGNRLDCDFSTSYNLRGKIANDSVVLRFNSFYGAKNGKASIKCDGDALTWRIIVWPIGGDCFAPESAKMYQKNNGW